MKNEVSLKDYRKFMLDQGLSFNSDDENYENQCNGWSFKHGPYTFYLVDLTEPLTPNVIEPSIYEFTNGFDEYMEIYQRIENEEYVAKHPKNFEEFKTMLTESIKDLKAYVNQIELDKIKADF